MIEDQERVAALRASGRLDKSAPERLEHLSFAAARLVLADAAQINALDHEMQYTVSGWPPGRLTPDKRVEDSPCRMVVLTGQPVVITDSITHPITCDLAVDFRGYVGVPVYAGAQVIGSLCVLTLEPRSWKTYEVTALGGVARLVGMSLVEHVSTPALR